MNKTIYVSCSWTSKNLLDKAEKELTTQGYTVLSNRRNETYGFKKLQEADVVAFVLDGFSWKQAINNLSSGVLKELVWCINNRVPLHILYFPADKGIQIYSAEVTEELIIKGIASTAPNIAILYTLSEEDLASIPIKPQLSTNFY